MKRINLKLRDRDEENLAVALMLNPSIDNQTDMLRKAIETVLEVGSTAEQIEKARKEYKRQRVRKQS